MWITVWPKLVVVALATLLVAAGGHNLPPLVEAARNADWDALRALIDAGEDVDTAAVDGATALHWASYWDNVDVAALLIRTGADVNASNDLGATPLWTASQNGSTAMVRRLLDAGANPDAALLSGETIVMVAARSGNPEIVEQLLAGGANPNAAATRGQTALMWAVAQQHADVVRALLAGGADVHARSEVWSQVMAVPPHSHPEYNRAIPHGGNTPLMFAARVGDLASAKLLVGAGANVNGVDAWGVSALVLAAHSGFWDIVEFLLEEGADPNAADAGFSALHLAIMRRSETTVKSLLIHGADPNDPLRTWTPTRRSSDDFHFRPELVGATPFWLAARFSQPGVMRLLAEYGADPLFVHHVEYMAAAGFGAAPRTEATTALMAAVGMGGGGRGWAEPDPTEHEALTLEAVKLALDLGVDVNRANPAGRTALDAAMTLRYDSVVNVLLANGATRPDGPAR